MNKPNAESCLSAARKHRHDFYFYRQKWERFKHQNNETAARAVYEKMVLALDKAVFLTKTAEKLAH